MKISTFFQEACYNIIPTQEIVKEKYTDNINIETHVIQSLKNFSLKT